MIWTNPTIPSDDLIWWSDPIWSDPMNDAGFDNTKFNVHVTLFITYCQCLASFSTVLVWRSGEIQTTLLSPLQEDGSNLSGGEKNDRPTGVYFSEGWCRSTTSRAWMVSNGIWLHLPSRACSRAYRLTCATHFTVTCGIILRFVERQT